MESTTTSDQQPGPERRRDTIFIAFALLVFAVVVLRSAWLSDDALITLRYIDNFQNGHGLRWNVAERVQGFTHPLWLILLTATTWVTGNLMHTAIWVGVIVSVAAVCVLALAARSRTGMLVAFSALMSSKAFIDYSTSGLENPLTHLLMGAFALVLFREISRVKEGERFSLRTVLVLATIASLGVITRHDIALLYAPAGIYVWWNCAHRIKGAGYGLLGLLPFWIWTGFAIIYYGFPMPNTAAAKLNIGIPGDVLMGQGLAYYFYTLMRDPVTLLAFFAGGIAATLLPARRESIAARMLVLGMVLYAWYILRIGGDFMAGRFFTPLVFWGALILARYPWETISIRPLRVSGAAVAGVLVLIGLSNSTAPLRVGANYSNTGFVSGIADERGYYYQFTGLLLDDFRTDWPKTMLMNRGNELHDEGRVLSVETTVGSVGFAAGPNVFVMDTFGLNDAFLARVPPVVDADWRPGHLFRRPPEGYPSTIATGDNRIVDPQLAELWDAIAIVTRGPLFSAERLREIWRLNTGYYSDHAPVPVGMATPMHTISISDFPAELEFGFSGIEIELGETTIHNVIHLTLDQMNSYHIDLYSGCKQRERLRSPARHAEGLASRQVIVSEAVARAGYDRIVIRPHRATGQAIIANIEIRNEDASAPLRDITVYPDDYTP